MRSSPSGSGGCTFFSAPSSRGIMAAKPARRENREEAPDVRTSEDEVATPAAGLDRLIHERMRLAILSALAGRDEVSFAELKALTGGTDGNVSVHARRLEEAGYV